ncbi:YD repeat-containing protein [Nitrosospira sp. Nsp5]|uniref:YD repeat-containing protein n=1 Tax=Nitrosospira multiformis TaxID=1231 RepID=A0ABY0TDH5_9PROT|nr:MULTISPECIES: RHS repeat domain-containing protein [Nitrosospira]PTR05346.1 YD repeat-containing protein [Nitrosospira sp. Nsp5]SDQ66692.1 YD repeat-containing protein [Nitrosospira multiformis]
MSTRFRFRGLVFLGLVATAMSGPALAASVVYTYDALGRLSKATYSTGAIITYAYDAAGNRTSAVTTGAP